VSGDGQIESVTGGRGGVEARYSDIESLAAIFDTTGDGLRRDAWDDKALALNGDLLESSILSPGTFLDAEAAVIAATIGPDGLAFRAVGLEADALSMQVNVTILRGADELVRQGFEVIDYATGFALGFALPVVTAAGLTGGLLFLAGNPVLTFALATDAGGVRSRLQEEGLEGLQQLLEDNPELVQHLINGGGGLLDGLTTGLTLPLPPALRDALLDELGIEGFHGTTGDAAGDLAGLFDDSNPVVTPGAEEPRDLAAPGSVEDLLRNLALTNEGADGEIDIQRIGEGDDARYVINLPGTDSWGDDPGDVRDLQSNLQLVDGQDPAYTRGIMQAMRDAGIPPGAPVMLAGHSQGGMAAMHLAADPDFQEQYDVRHVVTAGSPTAQVGHVPEGTQVLSLENSGDLVPLTDGEDNPDQPNRTTVVFDGRTGSIGENHSMGTYTEGGRAVDESDHPSITGTLDALRDDGFLGSDDPTSTSGFTITRDRG
jgi:hypothetical protein